jgi:hypothetical protein
MLLRNCRSATSQLPCQIVSREASAAVAASFKSPSRKLVVVEPSLGLVATPQGWFIIGAGMVQARDDFVAQRRFELVVRSCASTEACLSDGKQSRRILR